MKPLLPALLLGVGLSTATVVTPAMAYPVDCAILLCLAGGWPASAECAHARAVFIRRITPWPIEPPLQIWNCPMRASYRSEQQPIERLIDIAFRGDVPPSALSLPQVATDPILVDAQAEIDISDPAFDFVRSIRVFEITYRQDHDDGCERWWSVFEGSYGPQGNYTRRGSSPEAVPEASDFAIPAICDNYSHRSVFVEWRDFEGSYGHDEVHY
ncbi:MAG: hypothetical protein ACK4P4_02675 [Allorhizobium sp.]|nr:MAG: hypothetical protein A2092_07630 [Rhodobacteraceae bacterium GWE1_64_9]OHC47462.1 MAG: hypothetical protein A2X69_04550 [Rhodobacteraceae bacterium GWF1_65_7]